MTSSRPIADARASGSPQLVVIGDLGVDLVIGPVARWPVPGTETVYDRHEMRVGGSAGNAALAAAHLGGAPLLVASLGADALAHWVCGQLAHLPTALHACDAPTSLSVGLLHPWNERTFLTTRGHLGVTRLDDLAPLIPAARGRSIALLSGVFLMPMLRPHYAALIRRLRALGHKVALDSGWPPEGWTAAVRAEFGAWLSGCDHLLLNEAEMRGLTGCEALDAALHAAGRMMPAGATAVAKSGARGARAVHGGRLFAHATDPLEVFDTVGAGDAFNAGYLLTGRGSAGVAERLAAGCAAAAQIIRHFPRGDMLRQPAQGAPR